MRALHNKANIGQYTIYIVFLVITFVVLVVLFHDSFKKTTADVFSTINIDTLLPESNAETKVSVVERETPQALREYTDYFLEQIFHNSYFESGQKIGKGMFVSVKEFSDFGVNPDLYEDWSIFIRQSELIPNSLYVGLVQTTSDGNKFYTIATADNYPFLRNKKLCVLGPQNDKNTDARDVIAYALGKETNDGTVETARAIQVITNNEIDAGIFSYGLGSAKKDETRNQWLRMNYGADLEYLSNDVEDNFFVYLYDDSACFIPLDHAKSCSDTNLLDKTFFPNVCVKDKVVGSGLVSNEFVQEMQQEIQS